LSVPFSRAEKLFFKVCVTRRRCLHPLLAHQHGGFFVAALLGIQGRLFQRQGRDHPRGRHVFPGEQYEAPRSWTERAYPNLIYYNQAEKGGHFAAWEQPMIFTRELRAAFKPVRKPAGHATVNTGSAR
jgi:hypothetical protein